MSFFQKIGNAIVRFMYGRNGMDYLNRTLFWGYIGVFLAQILFNILRLGVPALICEALLWPLMLLILFRMFSKNLPKRRAEPEVLELVVRRQEPQCRRQGPPRRQGPQVFHLQDLRHGVPGAGGQGEDHHYLPQMRRSDPRQNMKNAPVCLAYGGRFMCHRTVFPPRTAPDCAFWRRCPADGQTAGGVHPGCGVGCGPAGGTGRPAPPGSVRR